MVANIDMDQGMKIRNEDKERIQGVKPVGGYTSPIDRSTLIRHRIQGHWAPYLPFPRLLLEQPVHAFQVKIIKSH